MAPSHPVQDFAARPAAPRAAPVPMRDDVPRQIEQPMLDPIDLDQALRDFRDAPEEVLRQDSAWADENYDQGSAGAAPAQAEMYQDPDQGAAYSGFDEGHYHNHEAGREDGDMTYGGEPFDQYAEQPPPRRRRGKFFAVGIMMGLLVMGGAVAYIYKQGFRSGGADGAAPIIRADSQPAKIAPNDPGGATIPNQGRLVYNRVSGVTTEPEAKIVSREEPVGGPPNAPIKEAARFPGGGLNAGSTQPGKQPGPLAPLAAAPRQTRGIAPAPRKVKTVIVRSDGSIVTVEPQSPSNTPFAVTPSPATPTPPPRPRAVPVRVVTSGNNTNVAPVQPVRSAPMAINPRPVVQRQQQTVARVTPTQTQSQTQAAVPSPAPAAPTALNANTGPTAYVVQIAARRNEQQALEAFNSLKSKYGGLISRYKPLIQRADLGPSGIYYRVRVGPMASAETANQLCGQLKAAGLPDCLVRPR